MDLVIALLTQHHVLVRHVFGRLLAATACVGLLLFLFFFALIHFHHFLSLSCPTLLSLLLLMLLLPLLLLLLLPLLLLLLLILVVVLLLLLLIVLLLLCLRREHIPQTRRLGLQERNHMSPIARIPLLILLQTEDAKAQKGTINQSLAMKEPWFHPRRPLRPAWPQEGLSPDRVVAHGIGALIDARSNVGYHTGLL